MRFTKESVICASPARVWAFHELPDALERLTPPWEQVRVLEKAHGLLSPLAVGSRVIIETRLFGVVPARWVAEHTRYEPPQMFEDTQISGPFKSWRHRHSIEPHADGTVLRDEIDYEPPLGFLGAAAAPFLVEPRLRRMFEHRHAVTRRWCEEVD